MTIPNFAIYRAAIDVQDACNLSGVVHSFSQIVTAIWDEARARGEGTEYVNTHPIVQLFLDKLNALAHTGVADLSEAWRICEERAQGRWVE